MITNRKAYSLIEMLTTLGLLGFVALFASRLIVDGNQSFDDYQKSQEVKMLRRIITDKVAREIGNIPNLSKLGEETEYAFSVDLQPNYHGLLSLPYEKLPVIYQKTCSPNFQILMYTTVLGEFSPLRISSALKDRSGDVRLRTTIKTSEIQEGSLFFRAQELEDLATDFVQIVDIDGIASARYQIISFDSERSNLDGEGYLTLILKRPNYLDKEEAQPALEHVFPSGSHVFALKSRILCVQKDSSKKWISLWGKDTKPQVLLNLHNTPYEFQVLEFVGLNTSAENELSQIYGTSNWYGNNQGKERSCLTTLLFRAKLKAKDESLRLSNETFEEYIALSNRRGMIPEYCYEK